MVLGYNFFIWTARLEFILHLNRAPRIYFAFEPRDSSFGIARKTCLNARLNPKKPSNAQILNLYKTASMAGCKVPEYKNQC